MKPLKSTGFTIVELLIVIVVIAILAAISIVAYNGIQERARVSSVSSALSQAKKKISVWQVDNSGAPADQAAFESIVGSTDSSTDAYCITATNGPTSYRITNTSQPTQGGCAGHGQGGQPAITNLAGNPSFENDTSGVAVQNTGGSGATFTHEASGGLSGSRYLRFSFTAANTAAAYLNVNPAIAITDGTTYRYSLSIRSSRAMNIVVSLRNSTTNLATTGSQSLPANTWTRFQLSYTASGGYAGMRPSIGMSTNNTADGHTLDIDSVMVTEGANDYNFADGNSANWIWNGTPNNSTSTGPAI